MKYFIDTEFLETGETIHLISIGIVAENGREFYAINEEAPWSAIVDHSWLRENVLPSLPVIVTSMGQFGFRHDKRPHEAWSTRPQIAEGVLDFIGSDEPEFWGYYADYDWVVFCWLFGRMIDLPQGFPMYCRDIKQLCDSLGNPALPRQESSEHNALDDARWNKIAYEFLQPLVPA